MVLINVMDSIMYDIQRQGNILFLICLSLLPQIYLSLFHLPSPVSVFLYLPFSCKPSVTHDRDIILHDLIRWGGNTHRQRRWCFDGRHCLRPVPRSRRSHVAWILTRRYPCLRCLLNSLQVWGPKLGIFRMTWSKISWTSVVATNTTTARVARCLYITVLRNTTSKQYLIKWENSDKGEGTNLRISVDLCSYIVTSCHSNTTSSRCCVSILFLFFLFLYNVYIFFNI